MLVYHIPAHIGFIVLLASLYLGHVMVDGTKTPTGIEGLNLAVQVSNMCIAAQKPSETSKQDYELCVESLDPIVWALIQSNDLDLAKCTLDRYDPQKGWCSVRTGFFWTTYILITNTKLLNYISKPASSKPPIPTPDVRASKHTDNPLPSTKKKLTTADFIKYKMNELGGTVNPWRDSMEAHVRKTAGLVNDVKNNAIDQYYGIRNQAANRINSVKDDAQKTVNKGVKKAKKAVGDWQKQADDTIGAVQYTAKSHVNRAQQLAKDLKGRVDDTALLTVNIAKDLGGKVKETWKKPLPKSKE